MDSTAAPICILVPISTWAIFFSSLLEANGVAEAGQGIQTYMQAIPYMAYGWVTLVIVLLVAMEKIPDLGAMKKQKSVRRMVKFVQTAQPMWTLVLKFLRTPIRQWV